MTNSTTDSDPLLYFQFEADFIQTLRCIPLSVRYKLDTCGVKLKLNIGISFPWRNGSSV